MLEAQESAKNADFIGGLEQGIQGMIKNSF